MKELMFIMGVSFLCYIIYLRVRRPYRSAEWERYKEWAPRYTQNDREANEFQELYRTYLRGDWR